MNAEREIRDAIALAMPERIESWFVTGRELLADPEPPPPAMAWLLDEGSGLLRAGRRYLVVGEPGTGKSLLALGACIEVAMSGRPAVFLDWEDSLRTFIVRSRAIRVGLTEEAMDADGAGRIFYRCMVGETLNPAMPTPEDCGLLVIDSVSRAMGSMGLDENSAPDFHRFVAEVLDPLREAAPEAALVLLDHPGHADPKRGRGTSAKRPVVDVDLTLERASRGLRLINRKDRHADMDVPVGATVAEVSIHPGEGDTVTLRYREPSATFTEDGRMRPTCLMERASRYLAEQSEAVTMRTLRHDVTGKERAVMRAVDLLAHEGFAEVASGPRGATTYRHVRLYTEAMDPQVQSLNGSRLVPETRAPDDLEPRHR